MNVHDILTASYGSDIYLYARIMDDDAAKAVEESYQAAWDSGKSFLRFLGDRDDDSEVEMQYCAKQMLASLEQVIQKAWLSRFCREEIVVLCNMLVKAPMRQYTKVDLAPGLSLTADDIAREWNKLNPDAKTIYPPADFCI